METLKRTIVNGKKCFVEKEIAAAFISWSSLEPLENVGSSPVYNFFLLNFLYDWMEEFKIYKS